MKTLGLIGGISWVSTIEYYRYINEGINKAMGGLNFAQCIIYSFNYAEIKKRNETGTYQETLEFVTDACNKLKDSGAEAIVLCANTMHMYADDVERVVGLPLINIATSTATAIRQQNLNKVALLGTKPTMERDFYKSKLGLQGIEAIIPGKDDRAFIHHTIFEELGRGIFAPATKQRYVNIINTLADQGAEGVILGCTEIPLLLGRKDVAVPVFDTLRIHADAAVAFSLT